MIHMSIFSVLANIGSQVPPPFWGDPQFWIGVGSLVLSAATILVTIAIAARSQQKKVLTYEIASNSSVVNQEKDIAEANVSVLVNGRQANNVRVFVVRLFNAGNAAITPQDYAVPPIFEFDSPPYSRPLISGEVQDTGVGANLPAAQLKSMLAIDPNTQKSLFLRPPLLNPRDSLFVRVLLMANQRGSATIGFKAQIKDGEIRRYVASRSPLSGRTIRNIVIGACIAFVLGILVASAPLIGAYLPRGTCALGSIQVAGSTAFYNTVANEQAAYNAICASNLSGITVQLSQHPFPQDSGLGLYYLKNGQPNGQKVQIADSELSATDAIFHGGYASLQDHPVGVVIFALIVNLGGTDAASPLTNLSTADIEKIYNGTYKQWSDIPPHTLPHLAITVVGRTEMTTLSEQQILSPSGTQEAFASYVLGEPYSSASPARAAPPASSSSELVKTIAKTAGAIGFADLSDVNTTTDPGGMVRILDIDGYAPTAPLVERGEYKFWAVEHMYTTQNPDPLTSAFIHFVQQHFQQSDTVISLSGFVSYCNATANPPTRNLTEICNDIGALGITG